MGGFNEDAGWLAEIHGAFEGDDAIMMERWHRFWRLSGFERGVVIEATGGLLATWLGPAASWLSPVEECAGIG